MGQVADFCQVNTGSYRLLVSSSAMTAVGMLRSETSHYSVSALICSQFDIFGMPLELLCLGFKCKCLCSCFLKKKLHDSNKIHNCFAELSFPTRHIAVPLASPKEAPAVQSSQTHKTQKTLWEHADPPNYSGTTYEKRLSTGLTKQGNVFTPSA